MTRAEFTAPPFRCFVNKIRILRAMTKRCHYCDQQQQAYCIPGALSLYLQGSNLPNNVIISISLRIIM